MNEPGQSRRLPMFPLGSVLMPTVVLPLHVFEPRYLALMDDVMAGDRLFGVCLIERGHEVGGADIRSMVGTVASVVESRQFDDDRWAVVAAGVHRIRVEEWLPDDPYPVAMVSDWEDEVDPRAGSSEEAEDTYAELLLAHRRVCALASEAGFQIGQLPDFSSDPSIGSLQLAATAPISAYDQQQMLAAPGLNERLPLLKESLDTALELVQFELTGGAGDSG